MKSFLYRGYDVHRENYSTWLVTRHDDTEPLAFFANASDPQEALRAAYKWIDRNANLKAYKERIAREKQTVGNTHTKALLNEILDGKECI